MSGKGNCYDNSLLGRFAVQIACQATHGCEVLQIHQGRADLAQSMGHTPPSKSAIFQYINGFYNPRRRHSLLGGKSPLAFEKKAA
jgi:putative transposase